MRLSRRTTAPMECEEGVMAFPTAMEISAEQVEHRTQLPVVTDRPRRTKRDCRILRVESTQACPPQGVLRVEGQSEAEPGPAFPARQVRFVLPGARIKKELLLDAELLNAMRAKGSWRAAWRLTRHATPTMTSDSEEKAGCQGGWGALSFNERHGGNSIDTKEAANVASVGPHEAKHGVEVLWPPLALRTGSA